MGSGRSVGHSSLGPTLLREKIIPRALCGEAPERFVGGRGFCRLGVAWEGIGEEASRLQVGLGQGCRESSAEIRLALASECRFGREREWGGVKAAPAALSLAP